MKLKLFLSIAVMAGCFTIMNRAHGDSWGASAPQPVRAIQSPAATATPIPRVDVPSNDADIQPPVDTNPSGDDLGFIGNPSRTTQPAANSATPVSPETMQSTVTAFLSNPALSGQDEISAQPSSNTKSGQSKPAITPTSSLTATNVVIQPTDTPLPSLKDKY